MSVATCPAKLSIAPYTVALASVDLPVLGGLTPNERREYDRLPRDNEARRRDWLAGSHTIVLSTHILPEVSQTCQRVVIINKGRVVAVDSPDNLTARLRGAETLYVQVDTGGGDAAPVLQTVPGVTRVAAADQRAGSGAFEVESERGRDVRRELAREIVTRGWGLLELRPMRMSLEEVFLQVTTEELPEESMPASEPALSDGGVRAEGEAPRA